MAAESRWLRLDLGWRRTRWVAQLDGYAAAMWPSVLCYVKETGVGGGRCKRPDLYVLADSWKVKESVVARLVEAAAKGGAMVVTEDEWIISNWSQYQKEDRTNAERQRELRKRAKEEAAKNLRVVS